MRSEGSKSGSCRQTLRKDRGQTASLLIVIRVFLMDALLCVGACHLPPSCYRGVAMETLFILIQKLIHGDRSAAQQIGQNLRHCGAFA